MGMVKLPVPTTFAAELPETVPKRELEMIATFAGPLLCPSHNGI